MSVTEKRGFFGVVADPQSYQNILYLLLAFPLGIFYFVFLVTGISLGFGLLIIWVGVPVLVLVLAGSRVLCEFERVLTIGFLKEDIPSAPRESSSGPVVGVQDLSAEERLVIGLWRRLKARLANRKTWTGMLYLFLKFPLGVASFTIAITLISVTLSLLTAPAYMWASDPLEWGDWSIDPFPWSWILTVIGIPMVFVSLHLMNAMALASGRLARGMLGKLHS